MENNFQIVYSIVRVVVIAVSTLCLDREIFGQTLNNFSDLVEMHRESRSAIVSYCVKIEQLSSVMVPINRPPPAKSDANKSLAPFEYKYANYFSKSTVEIACDQANDRCLVIRHTEPLLPELAFATSFGTNNTTSVHLIDGDVAFQLSENRFWKQSALITVPIPDPLSLGGGYCHEAMHYYPFAKVHRNLTTWSQPRWSIERKGSVVTFFSEFDADSKRREKSISFDSQKGAHPVAIQYATKRGDKFRQEVDGVVSLMKVDDYWMPRYVRYACSEDSTTTYFLDWFAINQPLPEGLFDKELLLSLLGIE